MELPVFARGVSVWVLPGSHRRVPQGNASWYGLAAPQAGFLAQGVRKQIGFYVELIDCRTGIIHFVQGWVCEDPDTFGELSYTTRYLAFVAEHYSSTGAWIMGSTEVLLHRDVLNTSRTPLLY